MSPAGASAFPGGPQPAALRLAAPARGSTEVLGRGTLAMPIESTSTRHLVTWRRLPWDPSDTWYRIDRAEVTRNDCSGIPHEAWKEIDESPTQATGVRAAGINATRRYCYAVTAGSKHVLSKPVAHVEPSWVGPSSSPEGLVFRTCDPGQSCPQLQYVTRVVPGDLDGDGVMDLIALASQTKQEGRFHLLAFVSGDGVWTRTTVKDTGFGPDGTNNRTSKLRRWMPLAVWDMDGDGRAEIFTRGQKDSKIVLRVYQLQEGTAGAPELVMRDEVAWPGPGVDTEPRSVFVVADLDDVTGDGVGDPHLVIQQGYKKPHFVAYRFDGTTRTLSTVSSCHYQTRGGQEVGSQGLVAADIDMDGEDELVACGIVLDAGSGDAGALSCTGSLGLKLKWRWPEGESSDIYSTACVAVDGQPGRKGLEVFMTPKSHGMPAVLLDSAGNEIHRWELDPDPDNAGQKFKGWERGWCSDVLSSRDGIECFSQQYWKRCVERYPNGSCKKEVGNFTSRMYSAATGANVTTGAWPPGWTKDQRAQSWPQDWAAPAGQPELHEFCAGTLGRCGWYTGWVGDLVGDAREESVVFGGGGRIAISIDSASAPLTRQQSRVTPLAFREYRQSVARTGVGYSVNFMPVPSTVARGDTVRALAPPRIDKIAPKKASVRAGETATIVVRGANFDERLVLLSRFTAEPSEHFRINQLVTSWSPNELVIEAPIARDTKPGPFEFQLRFDYGAGRNPWGPAHGARFEVLPPPTIKSLETPDSIRSGDDLVVLARVTPDGSLQTGGFTVWARSAPFDEHNRGFEVTGSVVPDKPGTVKLVLPDYPAPPGVIEYQLRIGYGDRGFTPWVTDSFRVR